LIGEAVRKSRAPTHIHFQAAASPSLGGDLPGLRVFFEVSMSTAEYSRKLDELDRLLNDPDVPMQPDKIWSLLADVSRPEAVTADRSEMFPPAE
jgi:hypothetical protein